MVAWCVVNYWGIRRCAAVNREIDDRHLLERFIVLFGPVGLRYAVAWLVALGGLVTWGVVTGDWWEGIGMVLQLGSLLLTIAIYASLRRSFCPLRRSVYRRSGV